MSQLGTVADWILDAVHGAPDCQLDDLVLCLPEPFLEVDRLSRTGQLRLTAMAEGTYAIRRPNQEKKEHQPQIISSDTRKAANHYRCCATESDFAMGYPRCHNLMVEETFVDWETSPRVSSFTGWRCLICGEILDPLILQHRRAQREPMIGRARVLPRSRRASVSTQVQGLRARRGGGDDPANRAALSLIATERTDPGPPNFFRV